MSIEQQIGPPPLTPPHKGEGNRTALAAHAPAQRRSRSFKAPYATLPLIGLLILWQLATYVFRIPDYLLPPPSAIARDMAANWRLLLYHAGVTTFEIVLGFILSVLIGVPLAALLSYSSVFERAVYPLIVGSNTVPKVALAPLLLAWFGFGLMPKIL